MSEPKLIQVVAGCVLEKDGKYLLVQEKQKAAYEKWNLPAGRVDAGETVEQAGCAKCLRRQGTKLS